MKKFVVMLAVLSVLFAACSTDTTIDTASNAPIDDNSDAADVDGADDSTDADDSAAQAAEPTAEPEAATTAPEADDAEPTTAPAATPTAAAQSAADATADQAAAVQAVVDADDWCQAADAVETGTGGLDTLDFTDPAALEQGYTQAVAVISAAQRLAPPEISDDVAQTIEAFTGLTAALEDAEWSFIDLDLAIINEFDGPMQIATYNIEKYNFEVCGIGVDPGDAPTGDDLTIPSNEDFEFDGTIRDQAVEGLVQAGFTAEQANCLFEQLDFTNPEALADTTQLFSVFTDCGISIDQLAQLGGG